MEAIGTYEQVDLGAISPSTTNPRKHYDDASMAELAASIRESGVQQPILLRPLADGFEIVCGERRYRAAKAAGLETIPAIVRELADETAYQAQIIENLQREDLGPMEEAESYGIIARSGTPVIDIASKVGKTGAYVAQRLQLLKLIKKAQEALVADKLPLGHAIEISKLAAAEQPKALEYAMESWRHTTLPQLKEYIQREYRLVLSKAPFSIKDASLHPAAGACVDCSKRTGADALLFNDVKEGDSCLESKCYGVKVKTLIHIRIEELKKSQSTTPMLSSQWKPDKDAPKGTIGNNEYQSIVGKKACESAVWGLLIDGPKIGQKIRICVDKKCETHRGGGNRFGGPGTAADQAKRKREAEKVRRDTEVRSRTAGAIVDAIISSQLNDDDVNIDDAMDLADYAFRRMDHGQDGRLSKLLGWDRKVLGGYGASKERRDTLAGLGLRKAVSFAVLATVAGDLTPQSWDKQTGLTDLAKRHYIDVAKIAAAVDAEVKAKATAKAEKKKPVAKKGLKSKPKKLSAEARKRINDAMKKRWAARRKAAAK
jgi:ParB family chromosome partitioning protein